MPIYGIIAKADHVCMKFIAYDNKYVCTYVYAYILTINCACTELAMYVTMYLCI